MWLPSVPLSPSLITNRTREKTKHYKLSLQPILSSCGYCSCSFSTTSWLLRFQWSVPIGTMDSKADPPWVLHTNGYLPNNLVHLSSHHLLLLSSLLLECWPMQKEMIEITMLLLLSVCALWVAYLNVWRICCKFWTIIQW